MNTITTRINKATRQLMKLSVVLAFAMASSAAMAQARIDLNATQQTRINKSDMSTLNATFSYESIETAEVVTERGTFSTLSMGNTYAEGTLGAPELAATHELIAIPMGANPVVRVMSYSTTDYRLADYGIHTVMPRQASVRKDIDPRDASFAYDRAAYQTRSMASMPEATVEVMGTMRGVQLGRLVVNPMSYDATSNTLRVFNDIEVEVAFEGADLAATEQQLVDTYSPYFEVAYQQLFNGRDVIDIYAQHPDLYTTPVKMMVVTTQKYSDCQAFIDWKNWKIQKGIDVIPMIFPTDTLVSYIQSQIDSVYNVNHPSFLVIVGGRNDIPNSDWVVTGEAIDYVSDMEYADVTGDRFPEMYVSRMPVSNTDDLANLMNKIVAYEQYTMTDPSYLNNAVLIAGAAGDAHNEAHAQPAVNYATHNYFNASHNFDNVYAYFNSYDGCYNHFGTGIGMIYYTGLGFDIEWQLPNLTTTGISNLPDASIGKYFWAFGNCCLAANWGSSSTCVGEKFLTIQDRGAIGYIGACCYSYWDEDYYFAIGANKLRYNAPTISQSTTGVFDALFMNDSYNTLNSFTLVGNLAVEYAHQHWSEGYEVNHNLDPEPEYYWKAYQTLGDGSVMPYQTEPIANAVSHASIIPVGTTSLTVYAEAGSYVALTKNNAIAAVAQVGSTGMVTLNMLVAATEGTMKLVVTRPQRQPYMAEIEVSSQIGGAHNVVCAPTTNGTLSVDKVTATAGEFVNITATPDSGYCLASLTVVDANNQSIQLNNGRFSMPDSDAFVSATFSTGHVITLASTMHGSVTASAYRAVAGERISLTATPANSDYEFDCWTAFKADDLNTQVQVANDAFTMPDFDIAVAGSFKVKSGSGGSFTVGSQEGTDQNTPTKTNTKYSICELLYRATEINQTGTISAIAFNNTSSNTATRNLSVYMMHTTSNAFPYVTDGQYAYFDWLDMPTSSLVFEGNVSFQSGWTDIVLNTPFNYNGQDNLLIGIYDHTNSISNLLQFSYENMGAILGFYVSGDSPYNISRLVEDTWGNATYRRNVIRFTMGAICDPECVSVSPTSVSDIQSIYGISQTPSVLNIVGRQLNANLTVTLPSNSNFEISKTANGTYSSSLSFTPDDHSVLGMVYIRLKNGLNLGNYNGSLTVNCGTANQNVTLSGTVTAPVYYTITATVNPSDAGSIEGTGQYVISTNATVSTHPNAGYRFLYWTEDGSVVSTEPSYSFTVTEDRNLVANFETVPTFTLIASASPTAGGTISGAGAIEQFTQATLTATANSGYSFVNWTENGIEVSTQSTYSFTMEHDRVLVANFNVVESNIHNIVLATITNGSVSANLNSAAQGATIQLSADAEQGYTFGGWYVYKTDDINTEINVSNNRFTMPAYDVTVAAWFNAQSGGQGGDVVVGDPDNIGESKYMPSMCYDYYSLSQQIYTPSEIGSTGTITHLAFRNNWNNSVTRSWDIYMKTTNKSNFNGGMENCSSSDLVFSGSVTIRNKNSGWSIIELDTPFSYNGQGNLLICVDDNTRFWSDPHPRFQTAMTNDGTAIGVSGDGMNYNPTSASSYNGDTDFKNLIQLTFAGSAGGGSSECLAVSPNVLSGFLAVAGGIASEPKSFGVVAASLEGNISVAAPAHYLVSASENGTYSSNISLSPNSDGEVKAMVYVKLMDHLTDGVYNNEKVTLTSGDAQLQVTLNGEAHDNLHVILNSQVVGDLNLSVYNQYLIASTGTLTVNGTMNCTDASFFTIRDGGQLYFTDGTVVAAFEKNVPASISATDGWIGIASPMTNATVSNLTSNTYDLYAYDEDADQEEWQNHSADNGFSFANGQGYLYANSNATTLSMVGTLQNTAAVLVPLSYNATYEGIRGFNLIGNPYAHQISMSQIKVDGTAITEYWRLDTNGQLEHCTSGNILPGEAFFIKATATNQCVIIENTMF